MEIKKCSSKNHEDLNSISFCPECKIYMCNKCEKIHSDLCQSHHPYNFNINTKEIFTGFCKEEKHNYIFEFFCKTHNKLCCSSCITKIKDENHGQHTDWDICLIKEIKEEKKKNLKRNIESLEKLSILLEESIKNLKNILDKILESKEELKLNIQKIFTKIRNELNEREDELLLEVDQKYNNLFFEEDFIKQNEKLPNKIKTSLEKTKINDKEWNDESNLPFLLNNCINIENTIKDINIINEKIENYNNPMNSKIIFLPEDNNEISNFIKIIKSFGKIVNYESFLEDSIIIKNNNSYCNSIKIWINSNKLISTLLYRKSENDDSYNTFHKLCDNKGATLTLIKAKEGFIIGGFTPLDWDNKSFWKKDNDTFVFSLSNNKVYKKIQKTSNSIFCHTSTGPLFEYIGFAEHGKRNMTQGEFRIRNDTYIDNYNEIIPNEGKDKFFDIEEVEVFKVEFN